MMCNCDPFESPILRRLEIWKVRANERKSWRIQQEVLSGIVSAELSGLPSEGEAKSPEEAK